MYFKKSTKAGKTIEIYKAYTKHEGRKRATIKREVSKEEIERVNIKNVIAKLTLLMNANFGKGDLHLVLTYFREARPGPDTAKERLKEFLGKMRKEYKKLGAILKFIHVTEYKSKAIHHHILINNIDNANVLKIIRTLWKWGNPKTTPLDGTGQYKKLAEYFIKETQNTFREPGGQRQRYTPSRNLIRPEAKWKIEKGEKWTKNPKVPRGYYLDAETLYNGVNPFTGREYQKYMLISLEADPPETMSREQWQSWIEEKEKWISWKEAKLNRCNK